MYKYSLHKKSTKNECPNCHKKTLVLYVDIENGDYISPIVGRCDREINCGYHYSPKSYFMDTNQEIKNFVSNDFLQIKNQIASYHHQKELEETQGFCKENNFIQFLNSKFDYVEIQQMIHNYKIGTANFWNFGTVFWQIDTLNKVRGGKIIVYNTSGRRTKLINWIHAIKIKSGALKNFNLNQCFFGEHLIANSTKSIAIVESEKTACIMSILFDKYIWLAAGSLNGLNESKMEVLKDRKIILYSDLGIFGLNGSPFTIWKSRCDNLKNKGFNIEISELLEIKGTIYDRENGFDIADYFLENVNHKSKPIISEQQKSIDRLYQKNKNLKMLIDVFELTESDGKRISLSR